MKKLLEKWKGIVTLVLVSLSLYSCKDDDNSGISTESIIGVWEGIKADSWSIVPAAEATEGWWGQRPDKDSQYGTDISDYRVEFTADMFYRVYTYNEYTDKWSRGAVGKWSVSGNTLTMVSYYSNAYDEENPEIFKLWNRMKPKLRWNIIRTHLRKKSIANRLSDVLLTAKICSRKKKPTPQIVMNIPSLFLKSIQ